MNDLKPLSNRQGSIELCSSGPSGAVQTASGLIIDIPLAHLSVEVKQQPFSLERLDHDIPEEDLGISDEDIWLKEVKDNIAETHPAATARIDRLQAQAENGPVTLSTEEAHFPFGSYNNLETPLTGEAFVAIAITEEETVRIAMGATTPEDIARIIKFEHLEPLSKLSCSCGIPLVWLPGHDDPFSEDAYPFYLLLSGGNLKPSDRQILAFLALVGQTPLDLCVKFPV